MITAFSNLVSRISPSSGGVYESARLNDNLDGTGGITISWNSAENNTIPVGTSVVYNNTKYTLLEPYAPQKASAIPHYRYEVTFQHPLARLARVPFYIKSTDSESNPIDLHTSTYTGYVQTIAQKLADFFTEYGTLDAEFAATFGAWSTNFEQLSSALMTTLITVDFDGCSIRSAATRIADAVGCNVFFDWATKTIRFISGTTIDGEYYNCFRVLGGTTNMAKKTVSGLYAAVTQRLTLDSTWPGSMMYRDNNGSRPEVLLTRDLIFDDIFPKMELYIKSARPRYCYLTDENGDKIVDHYELNGEVVASTTEGAVPVYKQYCKWYVSLRYNDVGMTDYTHDTRIQIADKPLCLLFQPDYTNTQVSSPLAGREFEVVYFQNNTQEWEEDDVLPSETPFTAQAGEFRIVFGAEGETILPSLPADGLVPQVGNKVTLTNVAVEAATAPGNNTYKAIAQEELRLAALEVIALMDNDNGQYQYQSVSEIPVIGTGKTVDGHTGVVTNVSADLDTGVADITIGSWSRKTLSGGVRDKIDSVSVSTSGQTEGDRAVSKTAFEALWHTTKKSNKAQEIANILGTRIDQIAQQADAQFNIIFGVGDPTVTHPESSWATDEEKDLHLQDIYYDMNTEAASTGGRGWRWKKENGVYLWDDITDKDTLLSLQKIADVAGDGVLSGGAEKTRVFIEWKNAADEFNKILTSANDYGVSTDALETAYWNLWQILNDGVAKTSSTVYNNTPSWLTDLSVTKRFSGTAISSAMTIGGTSYPSGSEITPTMYREAWNDFYTAYAAVNTSITGQTQALVASKISYYASYNIPTPPYTAGAMWFKLASQNQGEKNGVLYQCINTNTTGPASMSDWKKVSNFGVSIGSLLATLYSHWEDKIEELHDWDDDYDDYIFPSIPVCIQSTQPELTIPIVWYNPLNKSVYIKYTSYKSEIISASGSNADPEAIRLFDDIYAILGEVTFTIWNYLSDTATLYDLYGKRSSFTDSFTKQTIKGELSVWMKGDNAWTQVLDNTDGILQNYGDHIVAAIYGVDAATARSMGTNLTLAKNFAQLMAQAGSDSGDDMKDVAGIKVVVDATDSQTGEITSGHVEIVGALQTSDGHILIDTTTLPYYTGPGGIRRGGGTETVMKIPYLHSDTEYTLMIKGTEYGGGTAHYEEASIELRHVTTFGGFGYPILAVIEPERIGVTGKFEIYTQGAWDNTNGEYPVVTYSGVGTALTPVTFTTADGKTVTVMGGIITDIS